MINQCILAIYRSYLGNFDTFLTNFVLSLHNLPQKGKGRDSYDLQWETELNEEVLLKWQSTSDTALGITAKFIRTFDGPWLIMTIILPPCYKISDKEGKIRGTFNKTALKKKNLREPAGY